MANSHSLCIWFLRRFGLKTGKDFAYRVFSHDVTGPIGVPKQWNGDHVGVPNVSQCRSWTLFLCNAFFCSNKFAKLLATWVKIPWFGQYQSAWTFLSFQFQMVRKTNLCQFEMESFCWRSSLSNDNIISAYARSKNKRPGRVKTDVENDYFPHPHLELPGIPSPGA